MSHRLSLRKILLYVLCCGGVVFIVLSTNQLWSWHPTLSSSLLHNIIETHLEPQINVVESTSTHVSVANKKKYWYFFEGTEFPTVPNIQPKLFPGETNGDRILEQLMYIPENYDGIHTTEKVLLVYNSLGEWGETIGSMAFHGCPISRCSLTTNIRKASQVDAILFGDLFIHPGVTRPYEQIWILYLLESPYHTQIVQYPNVFNWTSTYRRDSDLVAPYKRWTYYDPMVTQKHQIKDYAANKTKKVAWFVSNCHPSNGRLQYAQELAKHIPVDIYGNCSPLKCPRTDRRCFEMLEHEYKFYLAFENSNCRDYITEKCYINGLGYGVIPIVMGARQEDYEISAPQNSYIHVDDFSSPAELAAYLHRLDNNDELYNSYFRWKGTGEFINTHFWCRLCALLHAPITYRHYEDINEWWRGPGVCTKSSWKNSSV